MPKKKKETTGLLMAITPVTVREEKKKGGLLDSDRQQYQAGSEVENEEITIRDGRAFDSEGEEFTLEDIASGRLDIKKALESLTSTPSRQIPKRLSSELQEVLRSAEERNSRSPHIFMPIEIFDEEIGKYEGRTYSPLVEDMPKEIREGIDSGKLILANYKILKRLSDQYENWKDKNREKVMEESIGVVGAHKLQEQEREGNKGGGLLNSDRQRYQEGSEVPVSDFDYGLDADPPVELQDQIERQDSLITNINSFVQDRATILARDPGYSRVPSRWSILDRSLYRQGISPLENDINSAWTVMRNTARRENIDLSRLPAENEQEIRALIESLAAEIAQKDEDKREPKQEGGLPEPIPQEAVPVPMDTPMVMEDSMVPDEQMEDNYLDFVISESLDDKEEVYLMDKLEADPQLSIIFDKLIGTATEFSGSGPVDGPGSEVSDSIPARLSDGEFVLTAKATDELGSDNVQAMMVDAEARSDERQLAQTGGVIRPDLEKKSDQLGRPVDDEIRKGMLGTNPRLQQVG